MDAAGVSDHAVDAGITGNESSGRTEPAGERPELRVGSVYDYNANGPWGRIRMADGAYAWFHEEIAFLGGERIAEGGQVEFRVRYHDKAQAWQALSIRRLGADVGGHGEQAAGVEIEAVADAVDDQAGRSAAVVSQGLVGRGEGLVLGKVKSYSVDRGYGIIAPDDPGLPEVFVHHSRIVGDGFRHLLAGEPVEYGTVWNAAKERLEAVDVRPAPGRKRGVVKRFDHFKGFGFIAPEGGGVDVFFHHSNILSYAKTGRLTAEEGEVVWFETEPGSDGRPKGVRVKRQDARPPLFRFADMGREDDWLPALAAKAEPESWQHSVRPDRFTEYPILKSYLLYTFARLEQEDREAAGRKIAIGRDGNRRVACFNTGLVTPNQEEIFALFGGKPSREDGRSWKLVGFHAASDHKMLGKFDVLPELVSYFDDPKVLLYDRRRELYIDIDHVLDDNIHRFPAELQREKFLARQSLVAAKAQTQQRVYRNYHTAVPQFHRGEVQLLLPLCLMKPSVADLALVVSTKEGQYRGDTILTLDMAYSNARLLCRPDSDWLKP